MLVRIEHAQFSSPKKGLKRKGSMKRRKDGLYPRHKKGKEGIWCFRFKGCDGTWREKSTGTKDNKGARKLKKQWLQMVEEGSLPTDKADWTVEQACTDWVRTHAARLKSTKAQSNEQSYLRTLLRRLGSKRLKAITLDHLKNYQLERSREVRERPINLELGILINTLREENLWRGSLLKYKRLTEPESEVGEALDIDQLQRLEATASSNDAWQVAYCAEVLAARTGLRGGEIKKLRLGMIDLEHRRIRISRKSTKTNAGARWVELNQGAFSALACLCRRAELLGARDPEHFLLPADLSRHTKTTDPLKGGRGFDPTRHQMSWDTAWRRLRKAAGLPGLRFHNLRHTFVTRQAELGTPLQVVQDMVGHMSAAVTKQYRHISEKVARAAVDKLDTLYKEPVFVDSLVDNAELLNAAPSKLLN
jgi:integrase